MSEHVFVETPPHSIEQMTTYELESYKASLFRAIKALPEDSARRRVFQRLFGEVLSEQEDRRIIAQSKAYRDTDE